MANKRCLDCGKVGAWDRGGRCPEHKRAKQREYDADPRRRAKKALQREAMKDPDHPR